MFSIHPRHHEVCHEFDICQEDRSFRKIKLYICLYLILLQKEQLPQASVFHNVNKIVQDWSLLDSCEIKTNTGTEYKGYQNIT